MKKFSIDVCTTGLFVSKDYPTVCTDAIEIDEVSGIRTLAASKEFGGLSPTPFVAGLTA